MSGETVLGVLSILKIIFLFSYHHNHIIVFISLWVLLLLSFTTDLKAEDEAE
jgi:hypothetical protein